MNNHGETGLGRHRYEELVLQWRPVGQGNRLEVRTKNEDIGITPSNKSGEKGSNVPRGCSGRFGRMKDTKKTAGTRMEADNGEVSALKGTG